MKKHLDLTSASRVLNIGTATLKNWGRLGLIKSIDGGFLESDVTKLKKDIMAGKVEKLNKRANKLNNKNEHPHWELLTDKNNHKILEVLNIYKSEGISLLYSVYLMSLEKLLIKPNFKELHFWPIKNSLHLKIMDELRPLDLNYEDNLLGFSFQYLTQVGVKQIHGAYHTPNSMIEKLYKIIKIKNGLSLDPSCGSGNFLIELLRFVSHEKIYGLEIDPLATLIARANLTLKTKGQMDVVNQIKNVDSLSFDGFDKFFNKKFDLIVTNPPWGAYITPTLKTHYEKNFKEITSGETFSYFLVSAYKSLRKNGRVLFVLPESILNVKTHSDIRQFLLKSSSITHIISNKVKFSGVFTNSVTLSFVEKLSDKNQISVIADKKYSINQHVLEDTISLTASDLTMQILSWLKKTEKFSLKGNSQFALGIVTGNNKKVLLSNVRTGFEPIIKGSDLKRNQSIDEKSYINLNKSLVQQIAPLDYYRQSPKLIYRFICKELVFVVDYESRLTLNSANILIPKLKDYKIEVVAKILNSKLIQYYYAKKFNSIKVLRSALEDIPFPKADKQLLKKIENETSVEVIDLLVLELYCLPRKYYQEILNFLLSPAF